jgi:hypothetical protein
MRQLGDVVLRFDTTDRGRAELAVQLLRKVGVDAKATKRLGTYLPL